MWSDDGEYMYFVKYINSKLSPTGIMRVPKTGGEMELINADYPYLHNSVSPDGKWAASETHYILENGKYKSYIILIDLETKKSKLIAKVGTWLSHPGHVHPSFSQDSKKLTFTFADENDRLWIGYTDISDITHIYGDSPPKVIINENFDELSEEWLIDDGMEWTPEIVNDPENPQNSVLAVKKDGIPDDSNKSLRITAPQALNGFADLDFRFYIPTDVPTGEESPEAYNEEVRQSVYFLGLNAVNKVIFYGDVRGGNSEQAYFRVYAPTETGGIPGAETGLQWKVNYDEWYSVRIHFLMPEKKFEVYLNGNFLGRYFLRCINSPELFLETVPNFRQFCLYDFRTNTYNLQYFDDIKITGYSYKITDVNFKNAQNQTVNGITAGGKIESVTVEGAALQTTAARLVCAVYDDGRLYDSKVVLPGTPINMQLPKNTQNITIKTAIWNFETMEPLSDVYP